MKRYVDPSAKNALRIFLVLLGKGQRPIMARKSRGKGWDVWYTPK